jgi:hypothetical protein
MSILQAVVLILLSMKERYHTTLYDISQAATLLPIRLSNGTASSSKAVSHGLAKSVKKYCRLTIKTLKAGKALEACQTKVALNTKGRAMNSWPATMLYPD